jgi:hypothetical protein
MNTRRLLILADFLESIPDDFIFDLETWGHDAEDIHDAEGSDRDEDADDRDMFERMQTILTPGHKTTKDEAEYLFVECGYSACAVGHACLSHKLRGEGLGYKVDSDLSMTPTYGALRDFAAVEEFFDISDAESRSFFLDEEYASTPGPKDVAEKIRKAVATYTPA